MTPTVTCSAIEDGNVCGRPHKARGFCTRHYQRFLRRRGATKRKTRVGWLNTYDPDTKTGFCPIHGEVSAYAYTKTAPTCSVCYKEAWGKRDRRLSNLAKSYGLTPEQYTKMLQDQANRCAICDREFTNTPHVDHNHETGAVRALLCSHCNTGIGLFREDRDVILRAVGYLDAYSGLVGEDLEDYGRYLGVLHLHGRESGPNQE